MEPEANQEAVKRSKAWSPPILSKLGQLTEDEIAKLQTAEDPIALLLEMRPELSRAAEPR